MNTAIFGKSVLAFSCVVMLAACQESAVELQSLDHLTPEQVGLEVEPIHDFIPGIASSDLGAQYRRENTLDYRVFRIRNIRDQPAQVLPSIFFPESESAHFDLTQRFLELKTGPNIVSYNTDMPSNPRLIISENPVKLKVLHDFKSRFEVIEAVLVYEDGHAATLDFNQSPNSDRVARAPTLQSGASAEIRFRLKLSADNDVVPSMGTLCNSYWSFKPLVSLAYRSSAESSWSYVNVSSNAPIGKKMESERSKNCPDVISTQELLMAPATTEISGLAGA